MAKVKAVIFDMDGTVADTLASIAGFGNAALKAHGYPEIETERYRRLVGNGADVLMRRMLDAVSALSLIHISAPAPRAAWNRRRKRRGSAKRCSSGP